MIVSQKDKLTLIEDLIEEQRSLLGRGPGTRGTFLILKAVADDIRARDKTTDTIQRLERAIRNAAARKTYLGYEMGNMQEIAELVIGRWPTIKQALEKFE